MNVTPVKSIIVHRCRFSDTNRQYASSSGTQGPARRPSMTSATPGATSFFCPVIFNMNWASPLVYVVDSTQLIPKL
jgi:hypothetical protein